jgi:mRNA-degrading endonuclease toxin of MazEF toxin-antitoxin module
LVGTDVLATDLDHGPIRTLVVCDPATNDNLRTVPRALLTEPITKLDPARMGAVCRALAHSAGCCSRGAARDQR